MPIRTISVAVRAAFLVPMVSLAAALSGCGGAPAARTLPPVPEPVISGEQIRFPAGSPQTTYLKTVEAQAQQAETIRIVGRLVWDETRTARVDAPVAGRVSRILVAPGDPVRVNQPLAQIVSPEIGQAQADARRAEVDLDVAAKQLVRVQELHQAGVLPTKELHTAEAEVARARAERDRAVARQRMYGVNGQIDQTVALRAPVDGVVVERAATPGLEVRPEQAQPGQPALFVISDPTRLWARIDIPESISGAVKVGQVLALRANALPDQVIRATVAHVSDAIDPVTRKLTARASVDNSDRRLKAEMFVSGELTVATRDALLVPSNALFLAGEAFHAFVDEGQQTYARRRVKAEEAGFGNMRVLEGLKPGDRVVADGALLLQQMLVRKQ